MDTKLIMSGKLDFAGNTQVPVDGEAGMLSLTKLNRLRTDSAFAVFPNTVGNITLNGGWVSADVAFASTAILTLKNAGNVTMATSVFVVEGSINSTDGQDGDWFATQVTTTDTNVPGTSNTISTPSLGGGVAYTKAFLIPVAGFRWVRVRMSNAIAANAIAQWTISPSSVPSTPIPAIGTHPVTSTPANALFPISQTTAGGGNHNANGRTSACNLYELSLFNPTSAVVYVKLFNMQTTAILGTSLPVCTFPVPVNGEKVYEFGALGKRFTPGLTIAVTGGPLGTDTSSVGAGVLISATVN